MATGKPNETPQSDGQRKRKPTDPTIKAMRALQMCCEELGEKQFNLVFGYVFVEQYPEKGKALAKIITT